MPALPKKLRQDAIAEALCQVQFDCAESSQVPELVVGQLARHEDWREFTKHRLPASDVPASIRNQDRALKHQPILELRSQDKTRLVKIGERMISFHILAPYPGWEEFSPELFAMVDFVFSEFNDFLANKIGFRYINTFRELDHGVKGVKDLSFKVVVSDMEIMDDINLNYRRKRSEDHIALVRVASPQFVTARFEEKTNALVDVDVYTPLGFSTRDVRMAKTWIIAAHDFEKEEFFNLFTDAMLRNLVEA